MLKSRRPFAEAGVALEETGGRGREPVCDQGFVEDVASSELSKPPEGTTLSAAIQRSIFTSVAALRKAIKPYPDDWNQNHQPFA